MYRGTTPTLKFTLPFDTSTLDAVWVTIAPGGKIIINKKILSARFALRGRTGKSHGNTACVVKFDCQITVITKLGFIRLRFAYR